MSGVVIHMLIGLFLFIPLGLVIGFVQHMHILNEEEEERKHKELMSSIEEEEK